LKISVVHRYLENRLNENYYPSHHKWASDAVLKHPSWEANLLTTSKFKLPQKLEFFLNKTVFRGSPGSKVELASLRAAKKSDLIYSISGPLALAHLFPKKLLSWVFTEPPNLGRGFKLAHRAYKPFNLRSNAGFLCLTPKAEKYYSNFAPSKFIPWCVDLELFDGAPPKKLPEKSFFLASGKTYRDYNTLVKAANDTDANIRIIGPKLQKPNTIPNTVTWIDTSSNPPDQAIDYPTLKEWYAQCSGICIPLSGVADDTCGYTNMLEGMAMRKPVIMTRSGCLHFDPASRNFGILVEPKDSQGWSDAMNRILNDSNFASECGENARKIVEEEFSIERFNRDVVAFIKEVIELNGRN
jgi:glycosyltransferase involved in cell wall biosynthesis